MGTCCDPGGYGRMFSGETARRNADAYRKSGLDGTAARLARWIRERGAEGRTVLEVGGGVGGIQLELLRAGAAHATNVELSGEYEGAARELAAEAGVADRVDRRVADFVEVAPVVEAADVVVMHRVVCCYPYLERMLAPAADRARRILALTYPRATPPAKAAVCMGNIWFRLTRCSFRVFIHPPPEVERIAGTHGLRRTALYRGLVWESALFERG